MSRKEMREVTIYDFPKLGKIGGFFKSIIKKAVDVAKDLVKKAIVFLHDTLSDWEDYLLIKLNALGEYATQKLNERMVGMVEETIEIPE